jgi:glycosyltransferase involved in cell wall biosynthesis
MISVIIPVHKECLQLALLRKMVNVEKGAELIFVVQNQIPFYPEKNTDNEFFVFSDKKGRGNNLMLGLNMAQGDIIFIVHADTILPDNWYETITACMKKEGAVGGGFHLKFDKTNNFLNLLIWLSDCLYYFTGEMWGDRAIFIRSDLIKVNTEVINVPIMEDVRLSRFMRKTGKVKMLKECIVTSSDTFLRRGIFMHTYKILRCRLLYAFGADLNKIYDSYYS